MILRNLSPRAITLKDTNGVLYNLPALSDLTISDVLWSDPEFRRWVRYRVRDISVATSTAGDTISLAPGTTTQNTITPGSASAVNLTLTQAASGTANLLEIRDNSNTLNGQITPNGTLNLFNNRFHSMGGAALSAVNLTLYSGATGNIAMVMRGIAGQSGDLTQWQDNTSAVMYSITSAGLPRWTKAANTQTTVGAAGTASTLPSAPAVYLKVVDSTGTARVIPAYNP